MTLNSDRLAHRKRSRGFTLVEALLFGGIASVVLIGIIGLLSRGGKLLGISRSASGAQIELRILMERMSEDVAELVYLEDGDPFDSDTSTPDRGLRFIIRSTRKERGMSPPDTPTLRRIEYRAGAPDSGSNLRECVRSVELLADDGSVKEDSTQILARELKSLRLWPLAAVPRPDGRWDLAAPTDARATQAGATVACMVVDITVGRPAGDTSLEQMPVTSIVTKLWCRNRILELARGGLR